MRKLAAVALSFFLTTGVALADGSGDTEPKKSEKSAGRTSKPAKSSTAELADQIESLRKLLESQQQQIQQLRQELSRRDQQISDARSAAAAADAKASEADSKASAAAAGAAEAKTAAASVNTDINDLKSGNESVKVAIQDTQKKVLADESPTAIHVKGITITPGGFLEAATVFRTRGLASDINTPLNSIPFPGSTQSKLTEFNMTGRHSRLTILAEGKIDHAKLTGYYEMDWLGAGTTSNNNQSNSYVNRQRQIWGQVALDSGWIFTGGQQWSLVTETKKGLQNRTEATPLVIDPQYSVGFSWARQYGFRVIKSFNNDKFALGFSVEGPQTTLTAHGNANNFLIAAPGTGGGLYNSLANYSFNKAPDFVVKAAWEPGWGHYELFGVVSTFRARIFPCATTAAGVVCSGVTGPSTAGAFNDSTIGGGLGANARLPLFAKKLDVVLHFLGGDGVGRYSSAGLSDATVRPDGTLSLIRGGSALGGLEFHPNPKLDVYATFGEEYVFRTAYLNAAGGAVGYGSPRFNNSGCSTETLPGNQNTPGALGACTGDTRNIYEGSIGFWHRPYRGNKGTIQWGLQYSYLAKNAWSGDNNGSAISLGPKAVENMVFTSFRYILP